MEIPRLHKDFFFFFWNESVIKSINKREGGTVETHRIDGVLLVIGAADGEASRRKRFRMVPG